MPPTYKEQRSFFYFLFLALLTAFISFKGSGSDFLSGFLATLWGLFGFYRFLYLHNVEGKKLPKILTLPSRILFGLSQQQDKKINMVMGRFLKWDILLFCVCAVLFISWGLYCSLYPAETFLAESFAKDKDDVLKMLGQADRHYYPLLQSLSSYFTVALILFIGMSYAETPVFTKQVRVTILPFILIMGGYIAFFLPLSAQNSYGDFSQLRGMGWGQFQVFKILSSDQMQYYSSGFLRRSIELGLIGAYGLYLVFVPMFLSFMKRLFTKKKVFDSAIAVLLLFISLMFDFFWVFAPFIGGFQLLILAYLACFWRPS